LTSAACGFVFQAKLEMPTAKNAMRIPLSFTYSNRTELINESDVRGQIGISFNLDAMFVDK
jgi:outer membrane lipopolysaccharide assembly protein LptE/RlpB